jgi:hypothetical protein
MDSKTTLCKHDHSSFKYARKDKSWSGELRFNEIKHLQVKITLVVIDFHREVISGLDIMCVVERLKDLLD